MTLRLELVSTRLARSTRTIAASTLPARPGRLMRGADHVWLAAPMLNVLRKCGRAPLIGRGVPTFIDAGPHVVDDFPQAIPLTLRELDVIETYLGALLDDVFGKWE